MRTRGILLAAVAALLLSACGGDDGEATGAAATDEAAPETAAASEPASSETAATETSNDRGLGYGTDDAGDATTDTGVAVASSALGDIVVDVEGMTLYVFLPDDGGAPTCTEGCAQAWPPLAGPATGGEGVDASLLGTAEHPSGLTMVTYGGWPLYHFANDAAPGDVNGQGVGDNWYVIAPDGTPIRE